MEEELKCAECGFGNNPDHHYCRRCGAEIEQDFAEADQVLEVEAAPVTPSGCGVNAVEAGIVLFCLLVIFLVVAGPGTTGQNIGPARQKHCFANIRVLTGAIEMYNMDHSAPIRRVDASVLPTLIAGGYIRSSIDCPGGVSTGPGIYHSDGDLTANGRVLCSVHGSIDHPAPSDR